MFLTFAAVALALTLASGCSGSEPACSGGIQLALFVNQVPVEEARAIFGTRESPDTDTPDRPYIVRGPFFLNYIDPSVEAFWVDVWLPEPIEGVEEPIRVVVPPPYPDFCDPTVIVVRADLATGVRHRIPVPDFFDGSPLASLTRWLTDEEVEAAGGRIYLPGE